MFIRFTFLINNIPRQRLQLPGQETKLDKQED